MVIVEQLTYYDIHGDEVAMVLDIYIDLWVFQKHCRFGDDVRGLKTHSVRLTRLDRIF